MKLKLLILIQLPIFLSIHECTTTEYKAYKKKIITLTQDYEEKLGTFKDPFLLTASLEEANYVYNALLERSEQDHTQLPLFKVQSALENLSSEQQYDKSLLEELITNTQSLLDHETAKRIDLQSNLLALKGAQKYLAHFGDAQENEDNKDSSSSENYIPNTKNVDDKEKDNTHIVAQVNFTTHYFSSTKYTQIERGSRYPFKTSKDFGSTLSINQLTQSKELTIKPQSKRFRLFVPAGYVPGNPPQKDVELIDEGQGSFTLLLEQEYRTITLPLKRETGPLTPMQEKLLTQPVGFDIDEWPEEIKTNIINKYHTNNHNALEIAKAIANYISNHYSASKKALPERDPIEALKRGAFQCDMASYIMVSILRDIYRIPCRATWGYRAENTESISYLALPAEPHIWVEVSDKGEWYTYDPTPKIVKKPHTNEGVPIDQDEHRNIQENTDQKNIPEDPNPLFHSDSPTHLKVNESREHNPLKKRFIELLCIYTFNPLLNPDEILNLLNTWKHIKGLVGQAERYFLEENEVLYKQAHEKVCDRLKKLERTLFNEELIITYKELKHISAIFKLYQKIIDTYDISDVLKDIIAELSQALTILSSLKDTTSPNRALVAHFKHSCCPLVWQSVCQEYGITDLTSASQIDYLAETIKAGQLNDTLLLNYVYDYTNFILDAYTKPKNSLTKTWLLHEQKPGRDVVPVNRLSDWYRAIPTRSGRDILENIASGQAYMLARRKKVLNGQRRKSLENERMTIIGFDTSGSMRGKYSDFQGALIAAFVSRAFNDRALDGSPAHRVLLVPFDDKVGTPIPINTIPQALHLIKRYKDILHNTGGGTNIQAFLLQAMELIAQAQNEKNAFDSANIIVITDGESPIDYQVLAKARQSIHRSTPLQTMFVALASTNTHLAQFAQESQKIGAQNSFYRQFSHADITKMIENSSKMFQQEESHYQSSTHPKNIPARALEHIRKSIKKYDHFTHLTRQRITTPHSLTNLPFLKKQPLQTFTTKRPLENWILEIRKCIAHAKGLNHKMLRFALYNLMIDFEQLTGLTFSELSIYEHEQLVHLLENLPNA